jgi:hypothetical protein
LDAQEIWQDSLNAFLPKQLAQGIAQARQISLIVLLEFGKE